VPPVRNLLLSRAFAAAALAASPTSSILDPSPPFCAARQQRRHTRFIR
jgi:hypothetical protein